MLWSEPAMNSYPGHLSLEPSAYEFRRLAPERHHGHVICLGRSEHREQESLESRDSSDSRSHCSPEHHVYVLCEMEVMRNESSSALPAAKILPFRMALTFRICEMTISE